MTGRELADFLEGGVGIVVEIATPTTTPLEWIRNAFEGAMPAVIATCSADGVPNIGYLSHVSYFDSTHVALSFQFFNKTHRYLAENSRACVQVIEPASMQHYNLELVFEQTRTKGPVFDKMRIKLDAIAALTGMTGIFRLRGADVFRVVSCRPVRNNVIAPGGIENKVLETHEHAMRGLVELGQKLTGCQNLEELFSTFSGRSTTSSVITARR